MIRTLNIDRDKVQYIRSSNNGLLYDDERSRRTDELKHDSANET